MIDLAGAFYRFEGERDQAIRERFDLSSVRFWQQINVLIDTPEALVAAPVIVHRLQRLRSQRQSERSRRRLA